MVSNVQGFCTVSKYRVPLVGSEIARRNSVTQPHMRRENQPTVCAGAWVCMCNTTGEKISIKWGSHLLSDSHTQHTTDISPLESEMEVACHHYVSTCANDRGLHLSLIYIKKSQSC